MNQRNKIKRAPKRGHYDQETAYRILDENFICHIALNHGHQIISIPTIYGRQGDQLLIHGASVSRLIQQAEKGIDLSLSISSTKALVLAKSAFHHSLNYESVVIFGKAKLVTDNQKEEALKCISDHMIPGRWEECRPPNEKELKATSVVRIKIEDFSAKIRTGPPSDDKADESLDIWSGIVGVQEQYTQVTPSSGSHKNLPESVKNLLEKQKASGR